MRRRLAALLLVALRVTGAPGAGVAEDGDRRATSPVPDPAAVRQADKLVAELFATALASARTDRQKVDVAEKLVDQAAATRDAAEAYALLQRARSIAVDVGDFALAMDVVDQLAATFDVDVFDQKRVTLEALSHHDLSPSQCRVLAEHAWRMIDACVVAGRYNVARQTGEVVVRRLRRVRDEQYLKVFVQRLKQIDAFDQQQAAVSAALERLQREPLDADANRIVGQYRAFVARDWEQGLPMLALGSDPELRELAVAELRQPAELEDRIDLADRWWACAEARRGHVAEACRQRAATWYRDALGQATGLNKVRIEQRIRQVQLASAIVSATSAAEQPVRGEPSQDDRLRHEAARILQQAADGLEPVCAMLWAGGAVRDLDPDAAAEPFQGRPDRRRGGANGLLIHAPRGWGGRGTVWSCEYRRKEPAAGIQFVHPFGQGHVVVTVSDRHLTLTSPGRWEVIGYGNTSGQSFAVQPAAGTQQPLRLTGNVPHRLASILTGDGAFYLFVDDRLFAHGQVPPHAKPLRFPAEFTGLDGRQPLRPGRAAIVIGPVEPPGGVNRAHQVRFGHARARRG